MKNNFLKIIISLTAIVVIVIRILAPNLGIDNTMLILVAMVLVPWIPSIVIKGFEFGGFKVEVSEGQPAAIAHTETIQPASSEPVRSKVVSQSYGDSYGTRLLKYTPLELIIAFLLTNNMVMSKSAALPYGVRSLAWANFGALLFVTPVYLWRIAGVNRPGQLLISSLSFAVWVFALGGPFSTLGWYQPVYGAMVLAVFTFVVPLITE